MGGGVGVGGGGKYPDVHKRTQREVRGARADTTDGCKEKWLALFKRQRDRAGASLA